MTTLKERDEIIDFLQSHEKSCRCEMCTAFMDAPSAMVGLERVWNLRSKLKGEPNAK